MHNNDVCMCVYVFMYASAVHVCYWATLGKEGSVLFNDTLNTFYLRLYGDVSLGKDLYP